MLTIQWTRTISDNSKEPVLWRTTMIMLRFESLNASYLYSLSLSLSLSMAVWLSANLGLNLAQKNLVLRQSLLSIFTHTHTLIHICYVAVLCKYALMISDSYFCFYSKKSRLLYTVQWAPWDILFNILLYLCNNCIWCQQQSLLPVNVYDVMMIRIEISLC